MKHLNHITCDVCHTIISFPYQHNQFRKQDDHFVDVCIKHRNYAKTFLIEVVSENLGFKDVEDRYCKFCNKVLSKKEVQESLKLNSFNFLCENHLEKYYNSFYIKKNNQ